MIKNNNQRVAIRNVPVFKPVYWVCGTIKERYKCKVEDSFDMIVVLTDDDKIITVYDDFNIYYLK